MTHIEMQNIILSKMQDQLQDTVDIRKRITIAFTQWFQSLIAPVEAEPQPQAQSNGEEPAE